MFGKLEEIEVKYEKLEQELAQPEIFNDQERYKKVSKAHAGLGDVVNIYREYKQFSKDIEENREMLSDSDPEIQEMAKAEISEIEGKLPDLEERLKVLLLPKDPMDDKNIILEIRAGTGGDEAALFGANLYRMYTRYAESNKWKVEEMSSNTTGSGGLKEIGRAHV